MARLIDNPLTVAKDHILLRLRFDDAPAPAPGQFINIRTAAFTDPLVRRPFSVFDYREGTFEIVVRLIGRGTRLLGEMRAGAEVDALGPLGNGFTLIEGGRALLVGGGVGNAPLFYLARELERRGTVTDYVYGARSTDLIYQRERFASTVSRFHLSTDDGSEGRRGYCTEIGRELLKRGVYDRIYVCGPTPMMEGMVRIASESPAPVEVSMENYFGCGIGLCSGCTVEIPSGLKRACVDGPVMDGREILWDSVSGGR